MRWTIRSALAGLLVLGAGVLAPAPPAEAATRTVPTSPGCVTINDCIITSSGIDTIRIQPGTYFQNVVIPPGKDGLTIQGIGGLRNRSCERVIVDAGQSGIGIGVGSTNVTLECLLVQHGNTGVEVDADGLRLRRVTTVGQRDDDSDCSSGNPAAGDGINVVGNGFTIERSEARGTDCDGIVADGDGGVILNSRASNTAGICIGLLGDGGRIEGNTAKRCLGDTFGVGIGADGDDNALLENRVEDVDRDCIVVGGNRARIERNVGIGCGGVGFVTDFGIAVSGDNPLVLDNRIDSALGRSILVQCGPGVVTGALGACSAGRVEGNRASGSRTSQGFVLLLNAPGTVSTGFQVRNNTAQGNIEAGFLLLINGAIITGNTATRNGTQDREGGFRISGDGNTVENNVARENKDDGFTIRGDGNTYRSNRSEGNLEDGFQVIPDLDGLGSEDNLLDGNTAQNNRGEGIENDGTLTDLTNNTSSGNRQDCAGDGTEDVVSGNTCADGTDFDDPGQIERAGGAKRQAKQDDDQRRRGRR